MPKRKVLAILGLIGLIGVFASAATNLAGIILVEQHDPIADTISNLAAGNEHAWLQDAGLIVFGVGLISLGIGLWRLALGGMGWKIAAALLGCSGLAVFLIAFVNEYGDADNKGAILHFYVVATFALMTGLTPWLMAGGLHAFGSNLGRLAPALTIAWFVLAPALLLIPTGYDGAYERLLGLVILAWTGWLSYVLWKCGRYDGAGIGS